MDASPIVRSQRQPVKAKKGRGKKRDRGGGECQSDTVWRFDGHTVEYSGQAQIGKTKHGTKDKSVTAIDRYTLYNGICALTDYFPTSVSYDQALSQ